MLAYRDSSLRPNSPTKKCQPYADMDCRRNANLLPQRAYSKILETMGRKSRAAKFFHPCQNPCLRALLLISGTTPVMHPRSNKASIGSPASVRALSPPQSQDLKFPS